MLEDVKEAIDVCSTIRGDEQRRACYIVMGVNPETVHYYETVAALEKCLPEDKGAHEAPSPLEAVQNAPRGVQALGVMMLLYLVRKTVVGC